MGVSIAGWWRVRCMVSMVGGVSMGAVDGGAGGFNGCCRCKAGGVDGCCRWRGWVLPMAGLEGSMGAVDGWAGGFDGGVGEGSESDRLGLELGT